MGSQGYWLPYRVASGAWQMEQDAWLLQRLRHDPHPCLRFYGWDQLTLSLGRHQVWPDPLPGIPIVRRPTGGRAVLHQAAEDAAELTYSLVFPPPPFLLASQVAQFAAGLGVRLLLPLLGAGVGGAGHCHR